MLHPMTSIFSSRNSRHLCGSLLHSVREEQSRRERVEETSGGLEWCSRETLQPPLLSPPEILFLSISFVLFRPKAWGIGRRRVVLFASVPLLPVIYPPHRQPHGLPQPIGAKGARANFTAGGSLESFPENYSVFNTAHQEHNLQSC